MVMYLSPRLSKSLMFSACIGSRILYARFRCKACQYLNSRYIPMKSRKSPGQIEVYKRLRKLIDMVPTRDSIICMGNFNSRLCWQGLTGKWCIHKQTDSDGGILLQIMRNFGLIAVSTIFQPKTGHDSATYLNIEPYKGPSQIDYVLMSRRWSLGVSYCLVKWGISMDRWGQSMIMVCWSLHGRLGRNMTRKGIA